MKRAPIKVLLDANVLYSVFVTDFLLTLSQNGLLKPYWTNQISEEWTRNLIKNDGDVPKVQRRLAFMEEAFPYNPVIGYEYLENSLTNDPKDRHVLAAALHIQANYLITNNIKDFPVSVETAAGVLEINTPDKFVNELLFDGFSQRVIRESIAQCLIRLKNPPFTRDEYIEKLCVEFKIPRHIKKAYLYE